MMSTAMSNMKKLVYVNPEGTEHYPHDIDRIIEVCRNRGYEVSRNDALLAWQDYSDSMCAGWMGLHKSDDDLFLEVQSRLQEVEE